MRLRLRYILPAAQMALAIVLLGMSERWYLNHRADDMPGTAPAFEVCMSINAPVALLRAAWSRYLPVVVDWIVIVLAVGLLWLWVSLNVESWRHSRTVYSFSRRPLRVTADLAFIALGAFWGMTFVAEVVWVVQARVVALPFTSWVSLVVIYGPLLAWSLALILFFGKDAIRCIGDTVQLHRRNQSDLRN